MVGSLITLLTEQLLSAGLLSQVKTLGHRTLGALRPV